MSWNSSNTFEIDGEHFFIDMSPTSRASSDLDRFVIVKNELYLNLYEELASRLRPRGILELGIFQGGSVVMLDKLFKPERLTALDISAEPIEALDAYAEKNSHCCIHYGTSQADAERLRQIVQDELAGGLDLVVDDASHRYDFSRRSFELLFPLLAPGGTYIIEDWAWSHAPAYQGDHPWADLPALTNLLFEQIVLMGSTGFIEDIRIHKGLYVITKSSQESRPISPKTLWQSNLTRGRELPQI